MATEQLGAYVMVAGAGAMLVLMIGVLGIRRVVWARVLVMLIAFALGLRGLGAITSTRRH
jgi:hypothetical protein